MRLLFRALVALSYLLAVSTAQAGFLINSFISFPVPPVLTFLQCANDTTDLTTYTLSAQNVGTAGATRKTIIGIVGVDNATVFGVSTVTVGGDSATEIVDEDGTGIDDSAIYILDNPVGTSEDVVVTFSEAISAIGVCLWEADGLSSSTAVASVANDDTASAAISLNLNTSASSLTVGVCGTTNSATATWVGLTERADAGGVQIVYTAADFTEDATPATPLTVSCDYTGTNDATGVAATFR